MNDNGYVETDPTGRYGRFAEVLGKGAMKTVYRAFDELNGIEVAWNQAHLCNVLRSPDALERMYSEVHLLSTLRHYSIIRFHGSWIDVGKRTFNFITEMFTSGTLREYRQRYRRVDTRAIKNWARQILHGLVYLHGHDPPVIHRDIKCDNIFINGHLGQVKIGDLGLAAILQGSQAAHSVIGTPEFMAPELYEEEYNELVDIYSFGMCVLEMLTSEYPYSECANPAQIYKKVTSGKLPHAFYRIQDPEARRFISRCLETVSKRSSAKELLLDPFLLSGDLRHPLPTSTATILQNNDTVSERHDQMYVSEAQHHQLTSPTDMTITGKMNPQDDTIFLKVQIADKDGNVRNVYFPFDIVSDTPIDVANEMVKELEITNREPSEIAEIIAQEISILVPYWKEDEPHEDQHHVYSYSDEIGNPFYYLSSPTSSQGSVPGPSRRHGKLYHADWIRDDLFRDDDDDTSSTHSGKYSAWNYHSGNEQDANYSSSHLSETQSFPKTQKPTRFCPEEESYLTTKFYGQWNVLLEPSHGSLSRREKKPVDGGQLMRNRSMVDVRSQLLHRTLVEELSKRLFKTVGAVENVGFNMVCRGSSERRSSSQGDAKKQGHGGGTG